MKKPAKTRRHFGIKNGGNNFPRFLFSFKGEKHQSRADYSNTWVSCSGFEPSSSPPPPPPPPR